MQSSCVSQDQWSWRQDLRPTLARGGWRGGLRPTLAREGWRGGLLPTLARDCWRGGLSPTLARGGWRESPRPTLAILRASGEFSPGRKSARRWPHSPNPAVSDAHGTVEHRESTILEGFPERRAVSGPGEKYARRSQACGRREEVCPGGNPPDARSLQEWSLN